jgi:myosin heavy subunit
LSLLICALFTVEEGLTWSNIAYNNNQAVIDLIAKRPTGLLNALEELSVLNRGQQDEGSLLAAYNSTHASNPLYERPRFGGNTSKLFTVKHYAGPVTYNVTGFLDKNNNALQEDLLTLLMCSSNAFVQNAIVATGMGVPPNAEHAGQPGYVPEVSADRIVQTAGKRVFVCAGWRYCCFPACLVLWAHGSCHTAVR